VHFLDPYIAERKIQLSQLLDLPLSKLASDSSEELKRAIISQRSIKSAEEIEEIELALNQVTGPMHVMAMQKARTGIYEYEIVAEMQRMAIAKGLEFAYPIICSVRGETLHNESYHNRLQKDQLLLIDSGVESPLHYASDITRTTPVDGKFNTRQKEIYSIVLKAQSEAIDAIQPNAKYIDIHLLAAKQITYGLTELGLMKGNAEEAVQSGAHALFFPHGLGHMMGLDVHDMEDLGEDLVGYDKETQRSTQFGTAYLRMGKTLQPGNVITVEPGIYFIPPLMDKWRSEKKFTDFINYDRLSAYYSFGGVRIEDNVMITSDGKKILGNAIPKGIKEIEEIAAT
jgi:Xaa-Pro aminopeptidase